MAGKRKATGKPKGTSGKNGAKSKPTGDDDVGTPTTQAEMNLPKERDREHWYKTLKGSAAKVKEAQSFHSTQSKKAQEAGIDTKALMQTIRDEQKDPLAVQAYLQQLSAFYEDRGMPMQFKLFDAKYGDSVAQAKIEGNRDGEASRGAECRWPEGSPEAEAYMAAWMEVQASRVNGGQSSGPAN